VRRAVFLDRDGTLNEDPGYFHEVDKLVVYPGVPESLRELKEAGFLLIVVTNQGAIGKGLYPVADMEAIHTAMQAYFAPFRVQIDDFFFCPHTVEANCACRKPKPGMFFAARDKYNIQLKESYIVGDKISDLEARRVTGSRTVLVLTGHGREEHKKAQAQKLNVADFVVEDIRRATKAILADARKRGLIQ
jgi:D-glycero-D-manno-heptose 1,7-bisphosphate phosphatase